MPKLVETLISHYECNSTREANHKTLLFDYSQYFVSSPSSENAYTCA